MCLRETKKQDRVSGNNTASGFILPHTAFPRIELPDLLPRGSLLCLQKSRLILLENHLWMRNVLQRNLGMGRTGFWCPWHVIQADAV